MSTVVSGYFPSPQTACSTLTVLCSQNPASCGFNASSWNFSNWSGVATLSSGGFPGYYCTIDGEYQAKVPPNSQWMEFQEEATFGWRNCGVYVSALFSPPAQCGPTCNGVGEPINPASGAVYDTIVDIASTSDSLAFKRYYNNTNSGNADLGGGWRHSFGRSITPHYSSSNFQLYVVRPDNSSLYNDEATACTSGFAEIKGRVSTWANAVASYANGVCTLNVATTVIGTLPILYESPPTPAPNSATIIGYDAIRDDGQLVSFAINGSTIVAPPSINLKLQQIANGYTLTDANDTAETYDMNGKLLSITSRAGVVQIMSYDTSGRLSDVSDSFGHQLTLSYDTQNRLITVTRQ
jgi:YD repeat-containing protein